MVATDRIRNFSIIAHIDHGKSTLADRFIQRCGALEQREMADQVLDSMDLERERGITIKAQSVSLRYRSRAGASYQLNVIDTPGHVDFGYEVSRSLAACEGALLVVDATQGMQAQSVANCQAALSNNLPVLPVLNKIDLPTADPDRVAQEMEAITGISAREAVAVSARTGAGVEEVLERLLQVVPPPRGQVQAPLQALIIDSWFDRYLGVVSLVRIVQGVLRTGDVIRVLSTGARHQVDELGCFTPKRRALSSLAAGDVGYVVAGIKDINGAPVGDTLTSYKAGVREPLPGFVRVQPKVFAGLFPVAAADYESLREALAKLRLNDAALHYEPESSRALGAGFRCGFLGMLHLEIVQERLEREYHLSLITSAPTVVYESLLRDGTVLRVDNPDSLPTARQCQENREPVIQAEIIVPGEYLGSVITLCTEKRGIQKHLTWVGNQANLGFELPMSEVVLGFFDRLKSVSRGYASFDYRFLRFAPAQLVRLDVLVNRERVDALSCIVHQDEAERCARQLVEKIKGLVPRQMYEVAIQAAVGSKVLARGNVKALRKDVTAKCYGGDGTRKRKLLDKQKAGKQRMKRFGTVQLPQSAFMALLHIGRER